MSSSTSFYSATVTHARFLPGIHGLRGLAALAVVLFHVTHLASLPVPEVFSFIDRDFGKGVHLFFVLSAYSLLHSTEQTMTRPTWMREYFIKRFFRIAPLFYCILAGMVLWLLVKSQNVSLAALMLNLTFTFGLAPWSGIVWAGWTVGVEMLFYALLPVLMMTVSSRMATLYLVLGSLVITYSSHVVLTAHFDQTVALYGYNWAYFSFPANLAYFTLGMYAYRVAQDTAGSAKAIHWGAALLACILLGSLLLVGGNTLLWGIGFAALALWQGTWPNRWCANKLFEYLGERSYSLYLLHPILIVLLKDLLQSTYVQLFPSLGPYAYFICVLFLLLPLLLLAEATYRYIELPAIRHGKSINSRIRKKSEGAAVLVGVKSE